MSYVTYTPQNPSIATAAGSIGQCLAETFRGSINAYVGAVESKPMQIAAWGERIAGYDGFGALTDGGTIAAGAGLSVTVTPYGALVGNPIGNDATGTVGSLQPNATNPIYLYQDGTWDLSGTAAGHGLSMLWGQATTNASAVTAVDNNRRFHMRQYGGTAISTNGLGTITLSVEQYAHPLIAFSGTVGGTCVVRLPLQPYAAWDVLNLGSASTSLCGASGGSVIIASVKAARVACDGTAYRRLSADTTP